MRTMNAVKLRCAVVGFGLFFMPGPVDASVMQNATEAELQKAEVLTAITEMNRRYIGAYAAADAAGLARVYDEDGARLGGGGRVSRGRSAIEASVATFMNRYGATEVVLETQELWVVGEFAYEAGRWTYSYVNPDTGQRQTPGGQYVTVWRRQPDGGWRMFSDLSVPEPVGFNGDSSPATSSGTVQEAVSVERFFPEGWSSEGASYAPAVRVGDLLLLSGLTGVVRGEANDIEGQTRRIFHLLSLVLEEAGATIEDVVEITTYHVGMDETIRGFMGVKDEFMRPPLVPAWTAVEVAGLYADGALVELKAVALRR